MVPDRPPRSFGRGAPLFGVAILCGLAAGMEWPIVGIAIAAALWLAAFVGENPPVARHYAEIFSFGLIALWVARLI
jgi:hypothetical protein